MAVNCMTMQWDWDFGSTGHVAFVAMIQVMQNKSDGMRWGIVKRVKALIRLRIELMGGKVKYSQNDYTSLFKLNFYGFHCVILHNFVLIVILDFRGNDHAC